MKAIKKLKLSKGMYKGLPYMLFLGVLGMAYIANAHKAEKKRRMITDHEKVAEEKHWEYMSVRSDITYLGTQMAIEKRVASTGLEPTTKPPTLIETKGKE